MGGFKDAYQYVQPVTLRLGEESFTSSLYCSSAEGIGSHVSTLVEAFLVEVYRCRICQFASCKKDNIRHHVLQRHEDSSLNPHLPCLEKEDDVGLSVGMRVDDDEELDRNSSPYDLDRDIHSVSKSNEDQMDIDRMSFLLPMYGMFHNISPRSCDIGLGSNSDGNLHVAQNCEVNTLFEEERHEEIETESVFQLEDSAGLTVSLSSEITTHVQDDEMAQSAHLMTLGLCRISSTKGHSVASAKKLLETEGEHDAGDIRLDGVDEMQKEAPKEDEVTCILCQTVASSRGMLELHLKCHSGDHGFRCPLCPWESDEWVGMEQHWKKHGKRKSLKPHKCSVCPKTFRSSDSRDAHEKKHYKQRLSEPETDPLVQCFLCLEWCRTGGEWDIHQQCHYQGQFKCLHCDFTEKSWKKTLKHIHTQHSADYKNHVVHKRKQLHHVHKTTTYTEGLRRLKSETWCKLNTKKNSKGDDEGKEMSNKGRKDRVRPVDGEMLVGLANKKEFCCNFCDKKFSTKLTMRRHMGIHLGDKPFKCQHCNYSTRLKASLIQHLRVHTGEKPHKCSQCSYASIDRSSLLRHSRTHTQEKPYCCQYCPYSSIQKKSLDLHSRRHHTGETFPCHLCQYSTADRQLLVQHMKKHHNTKHTVTMRQKNSCSSNNAVFSQRVRTSKLCE